MKNGRQETIHSIRQSTTLTGGWRRGIGVVWLFLAAAIALPAQDGEPSPDAVKFKSLFSFDGTNGQYPELNLVQGFDGNLHGTTFSGGATSACAGYCGVFFKLTPGGKETTLYTFCSQPDCADGGQPNNFGILALGAGGDLYGTTYQFAANGAGTIFRITPDGALRTLYTFCGSSCGDQGNSWTGVVRGPDGNFYGVTNDGGNINNECFGSEYFPSSCGLAYRVTPQGAFSVIYSFCSLANCADGGNPLTQLILGIDGNLYGITMDGGASGQGTVFQLTLGGKLTTLHSFNAVPCGNGFSPCAPLVQANNGNFYGTTGYGSGANGAGTFFEITPSGTFTTLYNFCSQTNCADGAYPLGFVQGTNGNFYGAAGGGTLGGCGTLFEITATGTLTTLHTFAGSDGCNPAGLVQHTNGTFYGETGGGGTNNDGTLFGLSIGLEPFVRTVESLGKVGSTVQILGDGLSSATAVSFNGATAAFTVESDTLISATVPAGATTGFVTVTTSIRTLKSNVKFRVR